MDNIHSAGKCKIAGNATRTLLALDLATSTGWALSQNGLQHESGSVRFAGELGECASAFETWLTNKLIKDEVTEIVAEAPVPMRGRTSLQTLLRLYGLHVVLRKVAHDYGIACGFVNCASWRVAFFGVARAPKDTPAKHRRAWLKAAAISECKRRGWQPASDDEADALGILAWALTQQDTPHDSNPHRGPTRSRQGHARRALSVRPCGAVRRRKGDDHQDLDGRKEEVRP